MRNLVFRPISILFFVTLLFSCKKDSDQGGDSTPSMSQEKIEEGRNVQDEKPPRSEKTEGEFTFEGEEVTSPENLQNDEDANAKIDILTAGTGASSAKIAATNGMYGWFASSIGGIEVSNEYIYFFRKDGTYLYYNQKTSTWDWGYYYINKSLTMLVTDYGSEIQKWWKVNELTPTKCVWTHKTEGKVVLDGFTLKGAEKAEMTTVKFQSKAVGKNWYLTQFKGSNVIENDSSKYFRFTEDGHIYGFKHEPTEISYISNDTSRYSVASDGTLNIITSQGEKLDMEVLYMTQNQFSLFGTENEVGEKGLFKKVYQTQARMQATYDEYEALKVDQ